ncbi:MAG: alpha/beta hydrolase [Myxococcota bacterium]
MSSATTYLILACVGLVFSALTLFRVRWFAQWTIPTFVVGWLRGELALQTILLEVAGSFYFWRAGALEQPSGQLALLLCGVSWIGLGLCVRRSLRTGDQIAAALEPAGIRFKNELALWHGFAKPFGFKHPEVKTIRNLVYGDSLPGDKGGRNLLDLVVPRSAKQGDGCPVLLQIHGGGWMIGDKREQAKPLMTHLASKGWISVAINYRLSPKATMPDHIVDVKRAIAWIRENIEAYGGDPNFLCVTGGSAGGHLSSLAALTPNDPLFQPGFEGVDTTLDGCVPFYGVFDFVDRAGDRPFGSMSDMIGPRVFKSKPVENPELWDAVSPITRVHREAPPFFVVQGSHDSLVFPEEAVRFVSALREKSTQLVLHAELLGAQHAFEFFHSPRTTQTVRGVTAFLERVHSEYRSRAA